MKDKHTPEPWVYGPEFSAVVTRDKQGTVAILLPLGHTRDDEDIDTEMMDAHGRLMAAAPELLEILKESVWYIDFGDSGAIEWHEQMEKLIAKIEGDE